jgi:hypothetical protein
MHRGTGLWRPDVIQGAFLHFSAPVYFAHFDKNRVAVFPPLGRKIW